MAMYHCNVKMISRGQGRSAVGAAAYRAGVKLTNEYDGLTHDYTKKGGIVHNEIMLPPNAPNELKDRSTLWNSVERVEKRIDSQLAREIEVSLPNELTLQQQIELTRDYIKDNFTDKGMIADFAIHDKKDGNPHAHIMLTIRPLDVNGEWGQKSKLEYILDKKGERIKLPSGVWKSRKIDSTDWNKKETLELWRENLATVANTHLEKAGFDKTHFIDARSYEEQGIDKLAMIHLGHEATALERRGVATERGNYNRNVKVSNTTHSQQVAEVKSINNEIASLEREIEEFNKQIVILNNTQEQPEPVAHQSHNAKNENYNLPFEVETEAQKLYDLKKEYSQLNDKIDIYTREFVKVSNQISGIEKALEQMDDRRSTIKGLALKLNRLKDEHSKLGIFKGKEKKAKLQEINQTEEHIEYIQKQFKIAFGFPPEEARNQIPEIQANVKMLNEHKTKLSGIKNDLIQLQDDIEIKYKNQKTRIEKSLNRDEIYNKFNLIEINNPIENDKTLTPMQTISKRAKMLNMDRSIENRLRDNTRKIEKSMRHYEER